MVDTVNRIVDDVHSRHEKGGWSQANIHIASHVVHYGSAVFEGARCYKTPNGSAFFRLDAHMRRLYDSAKIYRMQYPLSLEQITQAVVEALPG